MPSQPIPEYLKTPLKNKLVIAFEVVALLELTKQKKLHKKAQIVISKELFWSSQVIRNDEHSVSVESIWTFHCGCKKMKILPFFLSHLDWIKLPRKWKTRVAFQLALSLYCVHLKRLFREKSTCRYIIFYNPQPSLDLHAILSKLHNNDFLWHKFGRKLRYFQ